MENIAKEGGVKVIFFMAGTSDARNLAVEIDRQGFPLVASVVTHSAAKSLAEAGLEVRVGRLNLEQMSNILHNLEARLVVDASHPFAEEAHRTAMAAAKKCNIPYIRYERAEQNYSDNQQITLVDNYEEAAEVAAELKGSIMLTTGSKTLQIFTKRLLNDPEIRLVARMLPRQDNMEKCAELGVEQKNIIAMQGPFSYELNRSLYQHYGTTVMVTKESGQTGAVDEKVQAALDMGIQVIVIGRPKIEYGTSFSTTDLVLEEIVKHLGEMQDGFSD